MAVSEDALLSISWYTLWHSDTVTVSSTFSRGGDVRACQKHEKSSSTAYICEEDDAVNKWPYTQTNRRVCRSPDDGCFPGMNQTVTTLCTRRDPAEIMGYWSTR